LGDCATIGKLNRGQLYKGEVKKGEKDMGNRESPFRQLKQNNARMVSYYIFLIKNM